MNLKIKSITLVIILFVTLLIGIFINYNLTREGVETLSQSYENSTIQATKNKGFSSGFAGSGGKTTSTTDFSQYKNAPTEASFNALSTYKVGNANDLNIQYHDTPEQIAANENNESLNGSVIIYDKSGNKIALPPIQAQEQPTYYQPGIFIHGASTFVPTYEDSVYLSRSNGDGIFEDAKKGKPIYDAPYIQGGICTYYKNNPIALEQACNDVDPTACASTSCCVLLGGSKCVSGNETGATMKANYSDMYIKNRDYYYFQGKCYGNCR